MNIPAVVTALIGSLEASSGVRAVTIGGSQAVGTADEASDWDIGVFYRGEPDLSVLSGLGTLHRPGSWGRFMNGGAWLNLEGVEVDVILRDLDVVEEWSDKAARGEYEVDQLLGYLAGFPSYTLIAEVASSVVVSGAIDIDRRYPEALAREASGRWAFQRDFSLDYARMHARRGDRVATIGNLVRATLEEAHRRMSSTRTWVLNEKRLLKNAGLGDIRLPLEEASDLEAAVDDLAAALEH